MRTLIIGVVALTIFTTGCAVQPTVDVGAEQAVLMERDKAWSDSVPDVDKIASFLTDDTIFLPAGGDRIDGKDEVRAGWESLVALPGFALSWTPTEAVVAASGDIGHTIGTFELTTNDPEGNPVTVTGKYIEHWAKQAAGSWKVTADMFNYDAPTE